MLEYKLTINFSHLKTHIEKSYMSILHELHKGLASNLALYDCTIDRILDNVVLENSYYSSYMLEFRKSIETSFIHNRISDKLLDSHIAEFMNHYLTAFIAKFHNKAHKSCYIGLTVNCDYEVIITMKVPGKRYVFN